jgi:hypothetical protein
MHTARLRCGTVLHYESWSFLPTAGELVPCRRHGYCIVSATTRSPSRGSLGRFPRRAKPRAQEDLEIWLRARPRTTVHALRRERFTLRMLVEAERRGLVELDLHTGVVKARRCDLAQGVERGGGTPSRNAGQERLKAS